ncbi:serologically defined colon cancer antigen 8 homolog [Neodiprion lecontei]|uniref:Serologically defined colon cancer antigen 8 homolog n=1 Tax=Neodiprion lecontei TaxID=441921 RepID=A0A6J0BNS8_NEOLC|nr:serologically defined colon cancer antigen 8 homolog [Neodiprion lecontei]
MVRCLSRSPASHPALTKTKCSCARDSLPGSGYNSRFRSSSICPSCLTDRRAIALRGERTVRDKSIFPTLIFRGCTTTSSHSSHRMLGASSYPRRGRYGLTTAPAPSTGASNTFLVRPRLPLRSYSRPKTTANLLSGDVAGYGRSKRLKSRKLNGYQKIDPTKKKAPDYTDFAYREAVSKLKYLLAESYTPRVTPRKLLHGGGRYNADSNPKINIESGEDTDDRSLASEVSQTKASTGMLGNLPPRSSPYLPRQKNSQLSRGCSNLALLSRDPQSAPPELMSFIERQEEYIEQLERESQYCRDELSNLLGKVREVVAENETLQDKNKNGFLKSVIDDYNNSEEENREPNEESSSRGNTLELGKGKRVKLHKILEGPSIVFESRISELEAQLTQARVELRKAQEENQANLRRLSESGGGEAGPEMKAQLERALRDKREVEMKVEELQRTLSSVRDREADTAHKAKRTLDILEQAQFEKTQAEAEMRRLKDELDRQHDRLREATQEANRRVAEERHQIERRYSQQVEQLSADAASHWDVASKSQLEAEKQRREIGDLRRELAQKQSLIDELKKELQSKISAMQSDLSQAVAEKDAAEQEISAAKLSTERADRQARQEQSRLQSEINSYKQRLERADADLVHCRRENLRLSEQIASLEKEVNLSKMVKEEEHRTPVGVTPRGVDNDKELASMIMDIETKHEGIVQSDEGAIAMTASPPPTKKRTVKVDLKVKVVPKKKSGRSDTSKTPLSAQEEMASLQDNLKYLTSQIQDSLVHQNELPPKPANVRSAADHSNYNEPDQNSRIATAQDQRLQYSQKPDETYNTTEGAKSTSSPDGALTKSSVDDPYSMRTTEHQKQVLQQSQVAYPQENEDVRSDYAPQRTDQDYAVETPTESEDQRNERLQYSVANDSEQSHGQAEVRGENNYEPENAELDYKMENYGTDNQMNYNPQYTDQSYDQYNMQEYGQDQYDQQDEHDYQEGQAAAEGQYESGDGYQNMQYEQEYDQNYTAGYDGSIEPSAVQPENYGEPQGEAAPAFDESGPTNNVAEH